MSAKLTSQELKDKANKNNPDVQIIGKYINSKTNIYVICKCGNTTSVRPSELYKSWRCFECGIKARKYINGNGGWSTKRNKEAKNRIIQKHKELLSKKLPHIELVGDYEDSKTKTNYRCKIHNTIKLYTPHSILRRKFACNECELEYKKERFKNKKDIYISKLFSVNKNIQLVGEYINVHTNTEHKCLDCGTIWKPTPHNILSNKSGCPFCNQNRYKNAYFYKNKPTVLYFINIDNICFKVGLTLYKYNDVTKCIKNRFRKENNNILLLGYIIFKNGAEGYELEQRILNSRQKYNSDILQFGGNSELLSENIIALDKYKFIKTKEII